MDLNKSREFFDPKKVKERCHVIGCGSIGGNVAELLVRYGIKKITIWDNDIVESHNLANQIYTEYDIGRPKTEALAERLLRINPEADIQIKGWYENQALSGYVFLCLDNIEVRRSVVENNEVNMAIEAMFDFRTTLLEGQCYMANWSNSREKKSLLTSMDFPHEEAKSNTPVSACGFELGVSPVVRMTAELGIANFTNLINEEPTKHLIIVRPYSFELEAY